MYSAKRRFRLFRHPGWATDGGVTITTYDTLTLNNSDVTGASPDAFVTKYSSAGRVSWAARISGSGSDFGLGAATDTSGNVFVCGLFFSALTVYNPDNTTAFTTLTADELQDGFVVKYDSVGQALWAARVGGTSGDSATSVTCDSNGNVYVYGTFASNTLNAFSSDNVQFGRSLTNAIGTNDIFIVKYNSSGQVQWITNLAASGNDEAIRIAVDSSNNVYCVGSFGTSAGGSMLIYNSDGNPGSSLTMIAGARDGFIVKYNPSGFFQWASQLAGSLSDVVRGVGFDSNSNVYIVGTFESSTLTVIDSGGISFSPSLVRIGSRDTFVVKYSSSGTVQWATRLGGDSIDTGERIAVDGAGNSYVVGTHASTTFTLFNQDNSEFATTLTASGVDIFVAKYNTSGQAQWVVGIGGAGSEAAPRIACNSTGDVYIYGAFGSSPLIFYDSNGNQFATQLSRTGTQDIFLAQYSSSGQPQWVTRMSGTTTQSSDDIALDPNGSVIVSGRFTSAVLTLRSVGF